jgi:hypothetical protein
MSEATEAEAPHSQPIAPHQRDGTVPSIGTALAYAPDEPSIGSDQGHSITLGATRFPECRIVAIVRVDGQTLYDILEADMPTSINDRTAGETELFENDLTSRRMPDAWRLHYWREATGRASIARLPAGKVRKPRLEAASLSVILASRTSDVDLSEPTQITFGVPRDLELLRELAARLAAQAVASGRWTAHRAMEILLEVNMACHAATVLQTTGY